MAHLIIFNTSKFDVSKETPNPINPIAGESVLIWLRSEVAGPRYDVSAPAAEDWGWYVYINGGGASYMVGASADAQDPAVELEWTVQLHKTRSLKEKLLGQNKLEGDDPLFALIEKIIRADSDIGRVEVTREV
jgi:hypothetical protein